jgi:type I restriction enzyme, S subunit
LFPKEWQLCKIGDIAETTSGGTPSRKNKEYYDGNISWVKSGELEDGDIYSTEEKITEEALKKSSAKLFPKGTLLIAMYGATVGKTAMLRIDAATNQAVCAIFPKNKLTKAEFIRYFFIYARPTLLSHRYGGAQPNISQTIIRNFEVTLPPLVEQHNIAYILSKIQSAIEAQEKIIQATTEIKKALMQKLFTEGLKGEEQKEDSALKWDKVKLGSLAEKGIVEFQNGFPCGQWNESGVGIPQLRPFNVTDFGKIDLTQIKSIETNKSVEKYKLKQNDIVFNNTNSEELVGKTALWQNGDGYVLSNHMTIIRIKDDNSINPTYLANFLHKKWFDGHYKMVCRRHVNQASVSIERLKDIDLPYPPIDVQHEIAKSFISIDKKIEFANAKHQTLQVLLKSMLHHLMTGQIRVKDLRVS